MHTQTPRICLTFELSLLVSGSFLTQNAYFSWQTRAFQIVPVFRHTYPNTPAETLAKLTRILRVFLCPELGRFSPQLGVMFLHHHTENLQKQENPLQKMQISVLATFCCHTNRSVKLPSFKAILIRQIPDWKWGNKTGLCFAEFMFLSFCGPFASHDSNPYPNRSRIARYKPTKLSMIIASTEDQTKQRVCGLPWCTLPSK